MMSQSQSQRVVSGVRRRLDGMFGAARAREGPERVARWLKRVPGMIVSKNWSWVKRRRVWVWYLSGTIVCFEGFDRLETDSTLVWPWVVMVCCITSH
jgi:hypothetical protein